MKKLNIINTEKIQKKRIAILFLLICVCAISFGNFTAQAARKNKFTKIAGKTYYYNAKGKKVKGLKKIKGKYYYFDKKAVLYKKGWKNIKGKRYYFSKKSGVAYTGAKKIGRKKYFFSNSGRLYGSGIINYKGKIYYTKRGIIKTGWITIKGKKYYFSSSGAANTGWVSYKGKSYYFDKKGVMQKNKWIGNKYIGKDGYVIKVRSDSPTSPDIPSEPETSDTEPIAPEPAPETSLRLIYNEALSTRVFEDINAFRIANGKPAAKRGTNTLLKYSIIRGGYNLAHRTDDPRSLAQHGGPQIGLGAFIDPEWMYDLPEHLNWLPADEYDPVKIWRESPMHRSNMLDNYDEMGVAVMSRPSNGIYVTMTSVIVTFGGNGADEGPLYDDSSKWNTKEYISKTVLEVPFEEWETYLNCEFKK